VTEMVNQGDLITWTLNELKPDKVNKNRYSLKTIESDVEYPIIINDGRHRKRTYVFSSIKPVMDELTKLIELNNDKKIIIEEILRSHHFRDMIKWQYEKTYQNDYTKNVPALNYIICTLTEAAANLRSLLILNPGVTTKKLYKNWDKVSDRVIRKGSNQPNMKLALGVMHITQNEIITLKNQVKIFLKVNNELLDQLMELNPNAKRNFIYLAIGKGVDKSIFS
ncbi:MAG: hypothetical protein KKC68_05245, partial [Candidatus Thermoplasmatota archaeon]|nr:hypothetical protein [Candidatus Thermoplasmatota archaeon]